MTYDHVPETKFGIWFLGTETWLEHVLKRAIADLEGLIAEPRPSYPVILDVGCGGGRSFKLLQDSFSPERLIGIDVDLKMLSVASIRLERQGLDVGLMHGTSSSIALDDQSVDMVFCHQTFHHLIHQESAIQEFFRVLKPGGLLLFAESTRAYIESWIIRYLFRHPMDVQKTASQYIDLIKSAGFKISDKSISQPYLWWSRSDLGILQNWFGRMPSENREETLINTVAVRE